MNNNSFIEVPCPLSFFSTFLGADADGDCVSFATSTGKKDFKPLLRYPSEFEEALNTGNMFTGKNIYFGCAVLDGIGIKGENCVSARSIFCDIDYGTEGHKKPSPFATESDVIKHLDGVAIRPSMMYNSGHGVVAVYRLDSQVFFSDIETASLFDEAKLRIYHAVRSDATSSRQHYFRYPCTLNKKPGCPDVYGHVIQPLNDANTYALGDIIGTLLWVSAGKVKRSTPTHGRRNKMPLPDIAFGDISSPDDLDISTELHEILGKEHPEGTRSEMFFRAVLGLYDCGATLDCIRDILSQNPSFAEKYFGRIDEEILRCISKKEDADDFTPLKLCGRIIDLPLEGL